MDNKQTAQAIREWVARPNKGRFSWPTDACGYAQSVRFAEHRNANWPGEGDFDAFCLEYADMLESSDV